MKPAGVDEKGMAALRRSMSIMRTISREHGGAAFSKLRLVDGKLTAASLSRLLKSLSREGFVRKDELSGLYHFGDCFLDLARAVVSASSMPMRERVRPLVESLARETGESAVFFEPDGDGLILGAKAELPERFHYIEPFQRVGRLPAHGAGQVLLAWSSDECREALLAANAPYAMPVKEYRRRLSLIRAGEVVAPDLGEGNHNIRVLAPVFADEGGPVIGIIGVSFWEQAYPRERMSAIENAVRQAASLATRLSQK